ncbi:MAG: hypothetical protein ACD_10C00219G0001 [uncultured bacterium]|nr:MAG: hypothetical protein ACD_10C00219G0001 [uncultured bacterium]
MFIDQRITNQHARHAAVFLGEAEEQADDHFDLLEALRFFRRDLIDDAEQTLLNEFDQPFEHLRLAGEMAIKGGLRTVEPGSQCGGGDLFTFGHFEHAGQGLQNLQAAFARF